MLLKERAIAFLFTVLAVQKETPHDDGPDTLNSEKQTNKNKIAIVNSDACRSFNVCVPLCMCNSFMMRAPAKRRNRNDFIIVTLSSSRVKRRCFDDTLHMLIQQLLVRVDFGLWHRTTLITK